MATSTASLRGTGRHGYWIAALALLAGCAHAPSSATEPLANPYPEHRNRFTPGQTDGIAAPRPEDAKRCVGHEQTCFDEGMVSVQDAQHVQDGFFDLTAACFDGLQKACDVLEKHVTLPKSIDEMAPPGVPRLAIEHHVNGELVIQCRVPLTGSLNGCVPVKSLPYVTPVFVRWFTGKRMQPARFDAFDIEINFAIPVTLSQVP